MEAGIEIDPAVYDNRRRLIVAKVAVLTRYIVVLVPPTYSGNSSSKGTHRSCISKMLV